MKQILANYSFNAAAKTVTVTDLSSVDLKRVLMIVNVTLNSVMYLNVSAATTATVATNVITLSAVPAGSANSDVLQIFYDLEIAHDAVDFGNPQKIGGKASATTPTAVADGDRVNAFFDLLGRLNVVDDCQSMECQHVTLVSGTDTTITFAQPVRTVRVVNWDTSNVVLVKDGAISSNTDSTATRVGVAPATNVPNTRTFPFVTTTINLRSAAASTVTVEGFF